jgi:hypothetical protein
VTLTWQGEDTFKTMIGATLTWLISFLVFAYGAYRLFYLVNRFNPSITKTTLIKSSNEDLPFKPQETGFDFAFGLDGKLNASIGNFTVRYIN